MDILSQFFDYDQIVLTQIENQFSVREYQPYDIILSQEDPDNDVFIVLEGKARAFILSSEGHEIWLGNFDPGDMIGEMAAIANIPRTSNISAITSVKMAVFSASTFVSLMKSYGWLGVKVSEILINRVQETTRRMFELSVLSAPGRVYAEILRLSESSEDTDGEIRVIEPMPKTMDLARAANSTRETVSRAINSLEKMGLIIREDDRLKIVTPEKLGDMVC